MNQTQDKSLNVVNPCHPEERSRRHCSLNHITSDEGSQAHCSVRYPEPGRHIAYNHLTGEGSGTMTENLSDVRTSYQILHPQIIHERTKCTLRVQDACPPWCDEVLRRAISLLEKSAAEGAPQDDKELIRELSLLFRDLKIFLSFEEFLKTKAKNFSSWGSPLSS